jgi:hypothetical protein
MDRQYYNTPSSIGSIEAQSNYTTEFVQPFVITPPPLLSTTCPVIQPASGIHNSPTIPATLSRYAGRYPCPSPQQSCPANRSPRAYPPMTPCNSATTPCRASLQQAGVHASRHGSCVDGVHCAAFSKLSRPDARHGFQCAFGPGVAGLPPEAHRGRYAGHVDHATYI